jgi:hypothetical protein
MKNIHKIGKELFITSDEEIKDGDWILEISDNSIFTIQIQPNTNLSKYKKIILTTDFRLAPDVQKIDDEFLEWFVKNPSCEWVEVKCYSKFNDGDFIDYKIFKEKLKHINKIIIPKEEPKQETLEEVAEKSAIEQMEAGNSAYILGFIEGAKWQQERSYSEEDIKLAYEQGARLALISQSSLALHKGEFPTPDVWFEQFKNK